MADDTVLTTQTDTDVATDTDTTQTTDKQTDQTTDTTTDQTTETTDKVDTGDKGKLPESYELKLPENAALTEKALAQTAEFAKANQLTQDQAQAALDHANAQVAAFKEGQLAQAQELKDGWRKQAESDKEYGGDAFGKNAELASRALKTFASDDLINILKTSGYGNHPELVRMFVKIGNAMSEDQFESGNKGGKQASTLEARIYPNQTG